MPADTVKSTSNINRLIEIMARLRHPDEGCPWDTVQTFASIVPYTIEEAYEVADAVERDDMTALCDELGDLLLQVVFHARMAEENGAFTFDDVAAAIAAKLIRRHPHIFEDTAGETADAVKQSWEALKDSERQAKAAAESRLPGVLDDVPMALPALMRAEKLQKRAARVGFDWPDTAPVLDKIAEEMDELQIEMAARNAGDDNADRLTEEAGDLLFSCVNLLRHLHIDPEDAMRRANGKFERRFRHVESALAAQQRTPRDAGLDELETLWQAAKES